MSTNNQRFQNANYFVDILVSEPIFAMDNFIEAMDYFILSLVNANANAANQYNLVPLQYEQDLRRYQPAPAGRDDLLIIHSGSTAPNEIEHYIVARFVAIENIVKTYGSLYTAPEHLSKKS